MASIRERIDENGKKSFQAQVRIQGHPPQSKTFARRTDAKEWGSLVETEIKTGMHLRRSAAGKHTAKEMLEKYRDEKLDQKAGNGKDYRTHLAWWIEQIGEYVLSEVTTALITQSITKLKKSKTRHERPPAPATVLRYLMTLSHVFTVARKEWGWVEVSPVDNVQRPKVKNERTRYLSDDERATLLQECKKSDNKDLYLVVVLAIATGMRKGEILGIKWQDIHTSTEQNFTRVHLPVTKNGSARSVLLSDHPLELLREREAATIEANDGKRPTGLVFPSKVNPKTPIDLRKPWVAALAAAKIAEFRFHDLRHTAASYLALDGASLLSISKVLGHKSTKMTERYAHLTESHLDDVIKSMNEKRLGATKKSSKSDAQVTRDSSAESA
jgi:integrase